MFKFWFNNFRKQLYFFPPVKAMISEAFLLWESLLDCVKIRLDLARWYCLGEGHCGTRPVLKFVITGIQTFVVIPRICFHLHGTLCIQTKQMRNLWKTQIKLSRGLCWLMQSFLTDKKYKVYLMVWWTHIQKGKHLV